MLFGPDPHDKKVVIVASVAPPLIKRGLRAGDWIKEAAKACGGGGGGRPDSAQAGGKDPSLVPKAIDTARTVATAALESTP
jgi:alanyl-tRNA synthetase